MKSKISFHLNYFSIMLGLIVLEVLIAVYVHDQFIRPIVGDFIVVAVLYCFVRSFLRTPPKYLAGYVFIFASCVEVSQYFHLVEVLGVQDNTFLRIALGTTFDLWDIIAYAFGCALLYGYQSGIEKA